MKKILILLTTLFCIFSISCVYSVSIQKNLSENLTRLHIIANSNLAIDQSIKYALRDEILDYVKCRKKLPKLSELLEVSTNYLDKIGAPYSATVSYEKSYVPKKDYKTLSLPQGRYNCIKVTLGDGLGENWWCIAYPPLCYTESMFGELSDSGADSLSQILDKETISVITKEKGINFRFKIVDEIQKILNKK